MSDGTESKRRGGVPRSALSDGVAASPRPDPAKPPLQAGLYLIATPIGNSSDITLRALDVLTRAEVLAAEDTRQTRKLMEIHGIDLGGRSLVSYHDRNGPQRRPQIMEWLAAGKSVAYASDAGTPLIADPGYRLVEAALAEGREVHPVPGASAVLTALSIAGLPTDRFMFAGFLPPKQAARRRALGELASVPASLVFYESPRRLAAALEDMADILGVERRAAVARELTKKFEEVHRDTLGALASAYTTPPKGEIVIVVGPPVPVQGENLEKSMDQELKEELQTQSLKIAVQRVTEKLGLPRKQVYARALALSRDAGS